MIDCCSRFREEPFRSIAAIEVLFDGAAGAEVELAAKHVAADGAALLRQREEDPPEHLPPRQIDALPGDLDGLVADDDGAVMRRARVEAFREAHVVGGHLRGDRRGPEPALVDGDGSRDRRIGEGGGERGGALKGLASSLLVAVGAAQRVEATPEEGCEVAPVGLDVGQDLEIPGLGVGVTALVGQRGAVAASRLPTLSTPVRLRIRRLLATRRAAERAFFRTIPHGE
jgi:hypothetical protein